MDNQRGRKPAARLPAPDAGAIQVLERQPPPERLSASERAAWAEVVDGMPAEWFSGPSIALLEQYCGHVASARRIAAWIALAESEGLGGGGASLDEYERLLRLRERETRAVASLATKMRISQQATINQRGNPAVARGSKPWEC